MLLTISEYLTLGETELGYTELQDGRLLMWPNPGRRHMDATGELCFQLSSQLPDDLGVVHCLDIDLELNGPDEPGYSRRPDLIVVSLRSCELTKGASYRDRDEVTGKFVTELPFPFMIDLDTLD
ncbi:hypothetical protein [Alloactinosynnema sp. L-07]|uniref:Uma2 family endonuclease n=1 Tax=Alloactinosynnema sp. L-07 TaxID=1653480 RepID=UPI00065F00DE|nr:Uma2 family endonuclease [Alloactinosynnema sp. L-07]CRK61894.1 hypothetical protein [Alloactinosynnema sp. L-07]